MIGGVQGTAALSGDTSMGNMLTGGPTSILIQLQETGGGLEIKTTGVGSGAGPDEVCAISPWVLSL